MNFNITLQLFGVVNPTSTLNQGSTTDNGRLAPVQPKTLEVQGGTGVGNIEPVQVSS
jgi:hypothetical protein